MSVFCDVRCWLTKAKRVKRGRIPGRDDNFMGLGLAVAVNRHHLPSYRHTVVRRYDGNSELISFNCGQLGNDDCNAVLWLVERLAELQKFTSYPRTTLQWKKNKWTWLKIDTCSGHKVERVVSIRRRWPVAVVTEDNLSALSTFQQHISPSFTMAVINCRRRRRNGRRRWLLTWICFPICLNLSLRSNTQLTIELVRSQQSQANERSHNDDEKDKEAFGSCWQQFHSCGIWHESRRRRRRRHPVRRICAAAAAAFGRSYGLFYSIAVSFACHRI